MRQLKIGLVGRSTTAALLAHSFEQLTDLELVCFDAPEHPDDFVRLVRARRLNGIVLCGDISKRLYLTRKAGDEGLPAMVETPFSTDVDSAGSLLEERLQRGPNPALLAVSAWRFSADLQLARGILQGGTLGERGEFEIVLPADPLPLPSLDSDPFAPLAAATLIQQHGWQAMEIVRHLFGDVASLRASRMRSATGAPEGVEIAVQCAGEWSGRVSIARPGAVRNQWIVLRGSEAGLELNRDETVFINHEEERSRLGTGSFGVENWQRLANAFADVAAKRTPPWMSEAELLRTVELVQASLMSLGAGLAVDGPRRYRRFVAA
ncbi:MAG: hypothetical protein IT162_09310 [Bryobacterales bacterium]|nr:hypothetical protein [Bryobacterales bacterium]